MKKIIITSMFFTLTACTNNTIEHQVQCDSRTIAITFNDDTMELTFDNKNILLKKVISASGIKYQNQSTLVWLKGNNAIMTIDNKKFKDCKLIETL